MDPQDYKSYLEQAMVKVAESLAIPAMFLTDSGSYSSCRNFSHAVLVMPCEHCVDRDLWSLGLVVTLDGRVCRRCVETCMNRGITLRMSVRGNLVVASRVND